MDIFTKKMDHAAYMKRVRRMSNESLEYTIQDAKKAIEAMPDGPNAGYYADEIHYCAMELRAREEGK